MAKDLFSPIGEAIQKVVDECNTAGNLEIEFLVSFVVLDTKKKDVHETRVFAFGRKDTLKIQLDQLSSQIDREKGDFVNW